jgi:D-3-phosphoglycerate dehydrogenase
MVYVKVRAAKDDRSMAGTVLGGDKLRIVQVGGYDTDVTPSKLMLIFHHSDEPGIIGKMGTILGKHRVNIASMNLGRKKVGGKAIAIMNIDNPAKEAVLDELRKLPQILELKQVCVD